MTLVVSIKSAFGLVVAADGMAYYGYGDADMPHPATKVRNIRSTNWVFSFSGQGTVESVFHLLQGQIESGGLSLNPDIRIAVPEYFSAFDMHLGGGLSSSLLVAGFAPHGEALVYVHDSKTGRTDMTGNVFAIGAQHSTATWLVETFLSEALSPDDVAFLSYFAISQVAPQDLKVGNPATYRIDVCRVSSQIPPSFASSEEIKSFDSRTQDLRNRVQGTFRTGL